VRLRVVPWFQRTATAMVTTRSLADAVGLLAALRRGAPHLDAVELVLPEAMAVVTAHLGVEHVDMDVAFGEAISEAVLTCAAELGGTISAEHGVGVAKTRWLHLVRSPAELAASGAVKHALDPRGILNPGVLHPE